MTEPAGHLRVQPEQVADCAPDSLRAQGWRQGCLLSVELPTQVITVGEDGTPKAERDVHGLWALVAQDCDLAWTPVTSDEPSIELRPVLSIDPPATKGIRSSKFLLHDDAYVEATSTRLMVAPSVLSYAARTGKHLTCSFRSVARALKTWLGLRYDRPAVPGEYVDLYKTLSSKIRAKKYVDKSQLLRDVLVAFQDGASGPPRYTLLGVMPANASTPPDSIDDLKDWLSAVSLEIPEELGIASQVDVRRADEISVSFLEDSYALDTTDASWPARGGGPVGAVP